MLENFYEKVMSVFAEGKNRIELHKARSQFFEWAGQFDESSNDFEVKMSLFMEWFLLDRKFSDGLSPIEKARDEIKDLSDDELKIIEGLENSSHGVFEFLKQKKGNKILIKDLLDGQKYLISDVSVLSAFNKEHYFEARVVELNEELIFSGSFCFHAPQANKYILKEFKVLKKKTKKMSEDETEIEKKVLINKLFRMKHKSEQYKHIKIEEIYNNESKIKV